MLLEGLPYIKMTEGCNEKSQFDSKEHLVDRVCAVVDALQAEKDDH